MRMILITYWLFCLRKVSKGRVRDFVPCRSLAPACTLALYQTAFWRLTWTDLDLAEAVSDFPAVAQLWSSPSSR
jgi:hypothetical protein